MQTRKPAWWQLYMLVPLMGALLAIEHFVPIPGISGEIVVAGIVAVIFGAMLGWVHVNGGLLEWYEVQKDESSYDLKITVYEPASKAKSDGDGSEGSASIPIWRSFAHMPNQQSIQLKEEQKWFLN